MSVRERWIVYPLLFWAWAAAVKPHLMPTRFTEIGCEKLHVSKVLEAENAVVQGTLAAQNADVGAARFTEIGCEKLNVSKVLVAENAIVQGALSATDIQARRRTVSPVVDAALVNVIGSGRERRILLRSAVEPVGEQAIPVDAGQIVVFGRDSRAIVIIGPNGADATTGVVKPQPARP